MLKKSVRERLIGFRESLEDYHRSKPFEFQIFQTLVTIAILVVVIAFFFVINGKSNIDAINERADALSAEMLKIHETKIEELKKEYDALENRRLLDEAQVKRENDEKNELFRDGKNLEKNEKAKLEELNQLKNKNDLRGYSNELIKNLGY